ncbi:MAG: serine/threonine protein kinase [Planctomycetaceae bacterium]|jgi:tRNA A-37 threonylcarbamoyl transferase component Bud32|nr:serine/threonine protein kinase [Planctomycetaceae bacterium]
MTISESQAGTVLRCDRCGRIIETITGSAQFRDPHLSSSDRRRSDMSSIADLTPPIARGNSDQPHNNTSNNTSTHDDQIAPNEISNAKGTVVASADVTKFGEQNAPNPVAGNAPNPANLKAATENNKMKAQSFDEFVLNHAGANAAVGLAEEPQKTAGEKVDNSDGNTVSFDDSKATDPYIHPQLNGTVGTSNNDETVLATGDEAGLPKFPAGSKNHAKNIDIGDEYVSPKRNESSASESGRFGSTINLDLTKRVMATINQSAVSNVEHSNADNGGYGVHRILKPHQRGGMGRIMIAYDRYLKRDVALKELHKEVIDDISIVRRFIGEAEITAQLEHPGIVPIHSLGLDKDGLPYYTMKLIKGITYQDAIKAYHRNPTRQELKSLVRRLVSICKTIGFAHDRGVIHRDLKPANIMLGEHGETLVMDWGLAKPLNQKQQSSDEDEDDEYDTGITRFTGDQRTELTMVGAIVGTPAFMSPEQASPEENVVGTHSDIFSLGTILYYLLAGQTAFSGRSTREVLAKVRAASPPKPSEIKSNIPAGLEAVCMKAMAKNPKERYQTTKEMDEDLCRWLDDVPVRAINESALQKVFRWIGRHWVIAVSVPLTIVLLVMLVTFIIQFDRTHNAIATEESRRIALEEPVDLTEQQSVVFRGSHNIDVRLETRLIGGKTIVCKLGGGADAGMDSVAGVIEILAPTNSAWDLSERRKLKFSIYEDNLGPKLPFDNIKIRLGRGSAFFEYVPSKEFWSSRTYRFWTTYMVPLDGSETWTRTVSGNPRFETIDWIEFHFELRPEEQFQMDDITFMP